MSDACAGPDDPSVMRGYCGAMALQARPLCARQLQQLQSVRARQRGQPVGVGLKLEDGSPDICGTHRVEYEPQDAGSGLPPSC
ncbi:unnamed protein product [Boreogadus saida]